MLKLFQKKAFKVIEKLEYKLPLTDKKVEYYKKLVNVLVKKYSNYCTDYRDDEVFNWIMNNVKSDIKKRDMFYLLYHIFKVNKKRYENLVKIYDYKLFGVDKRKNKID